MIRLSLSRFGFVVPVIALFGSGCGVHTTRTEIVSSDSMYMKTVTTNGQSVTTINGVLVTPQNFIPAIRKTVAMDFADNTFEVIDISAPVDNVLSAVSRDGSIHIQSSLLGQTADAIDRFMNDSTHDIDKKAMRVRLGAASYKCGMVVINGQAQVNGICIESVTIAMPKDAHTRIYLNGVPALASDSFSFPEAISALKRARSDSRRVQILTRFVNSPEYANVDFTARVIAELLTPLSSSYQRLEGLKAFHGHISDKVGPEAVLQLFDSDHYRGEALKVMPSNGQISVASVFAILRTSSSDFYKAEMVKGFAGRISDLSNIALITSAIDSDFYKAEAVKTLIRSNAPRFIRITEASSLLRTVSSDFYKAQVSEVLSGHVLDPENAPMVYNSISSSFYRDQIIASLGR